MVRKVRLVLCVAALFLLQATVVHRFSVGALRPDLLYLGASFLALEADFTGALWGAFGIGLLSDLGSCGRLGASTLLLVPASALLAVLRRHLMRDSAWTDLVLTFAYVLAVGLVSAAFVAAFTPGGRIAQLALRALGQAAFTAALSPLVFAALTAVGVVDKSSPTLDFA
jgi:rod shape-determining protein MreD